MIHIKKHTFLGRLCAQFKAHREYNALLKVFNQYDLNTLCQYRSLVRKAFDVVIDRKLRVKNGIRK